MSGEVMTQLRMCERNLSRRDGLSVSQTSVSLSDMARAPQKGGSRRT